MLGPAAYCFLIRKQRYVKVKAIRGEYNELICVHKPAFLSDNLARDSTNSRS
jgi:hypothetical protein